MVEYKEQGINMKEQVIVITGATDGIGKVTARELFRRGYSLVLVGRNQQKLDHTKSEFMQYASGNSIFVYKADLSLVKETKLVAREIRKKHTKIYCLLNNAGAFYSTRVLTDEGVEATFALNHLSYFLLTKELLPCLENFGKARIVNVASRAHVGVKLDFDNLQGEKDYSGWRQYQRSKLMNIYFSYEMADRLKPKGITVNCLHPGFVKTKFGSNNEGIAKTLVAIGQNLFAISEDKGAETSIYLASSPDVANISGKYFVKCHESKSSSESYDLETSKKLWDLTETLLGKM